MEKKESNTERQRTYRDMGVCVWVGGRGDCFLTKNISVHDGVWCPFSSDSICVSECALMQEEKGSGYELKN